MSKQWVRQEIRKNELAERIETVAERVQENRQTALVIGGGLLAVIIGVGLAWARINKSRTEAWEKLAIAHTFAYQGQLKSAQEQLQTVMEGPAKPGGYAMLFSGDILFKSGQYKEAAEAYQKLIDRQGPKQLVPLAMANLGLALEAGGDCKAAIEANQRFLDIHQDHFMAPQAHGSLARCQLALGESAQAKSTLDRMVLLYPETYWAGWAKEKLNPSAPRPQPPAQAPKAQAPAKPQGGTATAPAPSAPSAPAAAAPAAPAASAPSAPAEPEKKP